MASESIAKSVHEALSVLAKHGVAVRVPSVERLDAMRLDRIEAIARWFDDPSHNEKPRELHVLQAVDDPVPK